MGRGRPRKTSVSSVETIDEDEIPYSPENAIVQPLSPTQLTNSDSWPCFMLTDAVVYYRDSESGNPETHWTGNLLHANYDGPFVVRGKLDAEDNEGRLQDESLNNSYVTLDKVSLFSLMIGQSNVGAATIWAAGECGWYELSPSLSYLPVFRQMEEAVTMYFSLEKILAATSITLPLEQLLLKYAVGVGDGITLEEAQERCKVHAPFFLSHCHREEVSGASPVAWSKTKFWRFLRSECTDVLNALRQREKKALKNKGTILPPTSRRPTPPPPPPPRQKSPSFDPSPPRHRAQRIVPHIVADHEMLDVDADASSSHSVPRKRKSPHVNPPSIQAEAVDTGDPNPDIDNEAISLLLLLLEETWQERENKGLSRNKLTKSTLNTSIYAKCSSQYHDPMYIMNFYSKRLVEALPSKWEDTIALQELRQVAANPNSTLGPLPHSMVLQKLQRRKQKNHAARGGNAAAAPSSPGASTPAQATAVPLERKRSRATRPPVYSFNADLDPAGEPAPAVAQPAPARRGSGRPRQNQEGFKPAGKTARLSLVARKRRASEDEDARGREQPFDYSHISKAPRVKAQIEDDSDESYESQSNSKKNSDDDLESLRVPIIIRTEETPSTVPKGPEGTWVCEEEGCGFIVRAADQREGQTLVEMHIEQHSQNREDEKERLINFAVAEGSSRHLPNGGHDEDEQRHYPNYPKFSCFEICKCFIVVTPSSSVEHRRTYEERLASKSSKIGDCDDPPRHWASKTLRVFDLSNSSFD
ncbi:hypothetical protein MKZ38_009049 [Zalerion maritima]|uniref:DNA (cytosine-5)-methyltransferase 1 replication foci domain-containing protein n=1 Tax=Zalerion maritima TaxID=339359 RepID=A0AAD5RTV4_9PEZI|nr:hypothetical protein MKZ38_009049 [Zalerion maritima]